MSDKQLAVVNGGLPQTAASATQMLDEAERALVLVSDTDAADLIVRKLTVLQEAARVMEMYADEELRMAKLRVRAERRWGELRDEEDRRAGVDRPYRPEKTGERLMKHLAHLPIKKFEKYLAATTDPYKLRRAGVLNALAPSPKHREYERRWTTLKRKPTGSRWDSAKSRFDLFLSEFAALAPNSNRRYDEAYRHLYAVRDLIVKEMTKEQGLPRSAAFCKCPKPLQGDEDECIHCGKPMRLAA